MSWKNWAWEPSVTAAHIGVTAREGVVTLSGHVESFAEKHAAEALRYAPRQRRQGPGGRDRASWPAGARRGDDDIARAALSKLAWNSSIPVDAVEVVVEKGWLTLSGDVDGLPVEAAGHEVRTMWGVVGVTNDIRIRPRINTANLSDDIARALDRAHRLLRHRAADRAPSPSLARGGSNARSRSSHRQGEAGPAARRGAKRTAPEHREPALWNRRARASQSLGPEGHPYHHPVIGLHEDLEAAAVST